MKTIVKSYKIRIYPNKSLQDKLYKNFGYNRFVFNQLLNYNKLIFNLVVNNPRINPYNYRPKVNRSTLNNWLNVLKAEHFFLKDSESTSLQSTCDIFKDSMVRFFKHQNKFPRFKSRKNPIQSIRLKNNNNSIRFENNKLKLPRFGLIRYRDNRKIKGDILTCTVKCENNRWFAVLNCKNVPVSPMLKTGDNVGIDLGLKDLMIFSNGEKRKPITRLTKIEQQIAKLNKKLSRKVKCSNNWKKNLQKLQKLYNKVFDIRNDEYQKLSTELIKNFDLIGLEKLSVKNMIKNKRLSHSISQISWSRLVDMIKYKAEWYDKKCIQISKVFPSSKLCNKCGYKKEDLTLAIREWTCPKCRTKHDRDINASINILNEAIRINNECTTG
ncbi:RNA-guided endonuclease TnpB family protein [Methanobrevibacter arboriphilus]|uniref:Transposase n=2 Tax=Methanobrevibacter arboriphilus TaxID=39441 RepID=A0ACA8R4X3_METAZ|nr:RNA-guided endonuclease TnpB family protein [Methanobrevibacter arboriphilus]BBL62574.1 transposase [Methanobrevibacter arboriphilus]